MIWILQAALLSLGLGTASGLAFSAGGWLATAAILFATATVAAICAGFSPWLAAVALATIVVGFNAGLGIGLLSRTVAAARMRIN